VIARVKISNVLGIHAREYVFGPHGAIIEGSNGSGKTSALEAIRIALTGRGANPTAIRKGADEAEILVDLDDVSVRRLITPTGQSVRVMRADGLVQKAPAAFLQELLGMAPLDPLDLVFERDPKKRRATILGAMPVVATPELLKRWLPPGETLTATECAGHGLEVVDRLRQGFYDRRALANKAYKLAEAEEANACARADQLVAQAVAEPDIVQAYDELAEGVDAEELLVARRKDAAAAQARAEAAASHQERTAKTRARVAQLRNEASSLREAAATAAVPPEDIDAVLEQAGSVADAIASQEQRVRELEESLEISKGVLAERRAESAQLQHKLAGLQEREAQALERFDRATELEGQALELEESIGMQAQPEEAAEAIRTAGAAVKQAEAMVALLNARLRAKNGQLDADEARKATAAAKLAAYQLDQAVKAFTNEAPAALLAAAGGIPGLGLDGDTITLDGVALDHLSGAEQVRFAVDITRRLNPKARLVIVDGLERLDKEQLPVFIAAATADGYQLIATRVDAGPAHAVEIGAGT
jgi:hypothetical protein